MNICITPESVKLISSYFNRNLKSTLTDVRDFDELVKKLYDKAFNDLKLEADDVRNQEVLMQHLSVLPRLVKLLDVQEPGLVEEKILRKAVELDNKIHEVTSTEDGNFEEVLSLFGEKVGMITVTPLNMFLRTDYVAPIFNKTFTQESLFSASRSYAKNIKNPLVNKEADVTRYALANSTEFKLKLVKISDLEKDNRFFFNGSETKEFVYGLVLTDKNGKEVFFDYSNDVIIKSEQGTSPILPILHLKTNFEYKVNSMIEERVNKGENYEKVRAEVEGMLQQYLDNLNEYIGKYDKGEDVILEIGNEKGSYGFVELDLNRQTPLSKLVNKQDIFFRIEQVNTGFDVRFTVPNSTKTANVLRPDLKEISEAEIDLLVELFTNQDLQNADNTPVSLQQRLQMVYYYFDASFSINNVNNNKPILQQGAPYKGKPGKIGMRIVNSKGKAETTTNSNKVKTALINYFNSYSDFPYVGSLPKVLAQKDNIKNSFEVYMDENGEYFQRIYTQRALVRRNIDMESQFEYPVSVENNVLQTNRKTYRDNILDFGKTIVVPSVDNYLRASSPSIIFDVAPKVEKVKRVRKEFFRTLSDVNRNQASLEREGKAADWLKNHPLSKVIDVNFIEKLHEKGPSFVASFIGSSINLFLGSKNTDIFHEAFHAYSQTLLSDQERQIMYNEIRKTPGSFTVVVHGKKKTVEFKEADDLSIEEYLAERFREYSTERKGKLNTRIKQFFDKILNILKSLFGNMTYNEAVALNKANSVVNEIFNNLYEGNIDISKFNPVRTEELYSSFELANNSEFSLHEISIMMESMTSLFTDFIKLAHNKNAYDAPELHKLYLELSRQPEGTPEHERILEEINELSDVDLDDAGGKGLYYMSTNERLRTDALTYVKNMLQQRMSILEENSEMYLLLEKALTDKNFGDLTESKKYFDEEDTSTLLGLFLNQYAGIKIQDGLVEIEEEDENGSPTNPFENKGNDKAMHDTVDEKTKFILSSIIKHQGNGKGSPVVNQLGIPRLRNFKEVHTKIAKLLNNVSDRLEMFDILKRAAENGDKEIKQVLLMLGNPRLEDSTIYEQQQWNAFRQSFDKATIKLFEVSILKKDDKNGVALEYRGGNAQSSEKAILREWSTNFWFQSKTGEGYSKKDEGFDLKALAKDYNKDVYVVEEFNGSYSVYYKAPKTEGKVIKTKRYIAEYREFFKNIGIIFTDDYSTNKDVLNPSSDLRKTLEYVHNHFLNRDTLVDNLDKAFGDYKIYVNNEKVSIQGIKGLLNKLVEAESKVNNTVNSFMSNDAKGNPISEKTYNSSATYIINALNKANHINDLKNLPGFEFLDFEKNPQIAASTWFVKMFNLDSRINTQVGVRNKAYNINIELLSGAKARYEGLIPIEDDFENEFKSVNEEKGVSSIEMNNLDKFITEFHDTFYNKQEIMRAEVKSTSLIISTPFFVGNELKENGILITSDNAKEILKGVVKNPIILNQMIGHLEYDLIRINNIKKIKEQVDKGEDVEFNADVLNRVNTTDNPTFYAFDSILSPETKKKLVALNIQNSFELQRILNSTNNIALKLEIEQQLQEHFIKQAEQLDKEFSNRIPISDNLIERYTGTTLSEISEENLPEIKKQMMLSFAITQKVNNLNFAAVFLSDAVNYKVEAEDYHKRLAGLISTGTGFVHDQKWIDFVNTDSFNHNALAKTKATKRKDFSYNGTLTTAVIKEKKTTSNYIEDYVNVAEISVDDYNNMKEADGAGWISFDAYRMLAISSDEWSVKQEEIYNAIVKGEYVEKETVLATFPVRKYQYFGQLIGSQEHKVNLQAFHKYSLFPLVPTIIEGTKLEKLHLQMMEQGVDYITMESGSKLSSISKVTLEKGTYVNKFDEPYTKERNLEDVTFTKNILHVRYLKSQVFMAEGYKRKVSLPTQLRSMIYLNIMSDGRPVDYTGTVAEWNKLSEQEKQNTSPFYKWANDVTETLHDIENKYREELLEDLGLTYENGLYVGDTSKIKDFLIDALKTRELLPEEISYILDENGNLISDLSFSLHSEQLEKILVSLVDKRLRKLKIKGEALVQVPNTMFEPVGEFENRGTNELAFYHAVNEKGERIKTKDGFYKIAEAEVKIALQGDFKKLLTLKEVSVYKDGKLDVKESRIKLNQLLKTNKAFRDKYKPLLTITGARIPSQSENSLESMVVVEFFDESAGPIIVLPTEIVAKAGSDYDIDKLFMMFKSLAIIGQDVEAIEYKKSTKSYDELKEEKLKLVEQLNLIQDELNDLYEQRTTFYELSSEISDEIKRQLEEEFKVPGDLFEVRKNLRSYLKQAKTKKGPFEKLKYAERKEFIEKYAEQLQNINKIIDIYNERSNKERFEELGIELPEDFYAISNAKINPLKKQKELLEEAYNNVLKDLYGKSVKGLENRLLDLYNQRITDKQNFKGLVHSNSTNLLDDIAKYMETVSYSRGYNKTLKGYSTSTGKIARDTIYDARYNLLKHQENTVGLNSLGIAAVTSTFYALFTKMGATLSEVNSEENKLFQDALIKLEKNPKDEQANVIVNKYRNKTLKLNHNKVIDSFGNEKLALGFIKNVDGVNISIIIEQLINGYVDVAKDAWIFNIQGNKENTPIILFMVMAGVSLDEVVYFTSNPLVVKYNEYKREQSGVFAKLNKEPGINPVSDAEDVKMSTEQIARQMLFNEYASLLAENGFGDETNPLNQSFYRSITNRMSPLTKEELKERATSTFPTFRDIEILAHYFEIEAMQAEIRKFTNLSKYATTKVGNIVEAYTRINDTKDFITNAKYIPAARWFEQIKKTPQGPFNNDALILDIFQNKFRVKNNTLLFDLASNLERLENVMDEVVRRDYINDFMWFLYQNSLFEPNKYLGYSFKQDNSNSFTINEEDKTLTVGKEYIQNLQNNSSFRVFVSKFLTVPGNPSQISRGHLMRYLYEYEKAKEELSDLGEDDFKEKYYYMRPPVEEDIDLWLSKLALYRANNEVAMFSNKFGVADILEAILYKNSEQEEYLKSRYEFMNDVRFDRNEGMDKNNIFLPEIKDNDRAKLYRENVDDMKNDSIPELAELFKKIDIIATLQTGMIRNRKHDLSKLINQRHFYTTIDNGIGIDNIYNSLNKLEENYTKDVYSDSSLEDNIVLIYDSLFRSLSSTVEMHKRRSRGRSYISPKFAIDTIPFLEKAPLATNYVSVYKNVLTEAKEDEAPFTQKTLKNKAKSYEELVQLIDSFVGKKIAISDVPFILPADVDYTLDDLNTQLKRLGVINKLNSITLVYVDSVVKPGVLSISTLPGVKMPYAIMDEAMANNSTKVISSVVPSASRNKTSVEIYMDHITKNYADSLKDDYKADDQVWIISTKVEEVVKKSQQELKQDLEKDFNSKIKPLIDKAIKAKVSVFSLSSSLSDKLSYDYLVSKGYNPLINYTSGGKYYTLHKEKVVSDLYDVTKPEIDNPFLKDLVKNIKDNFGSVLEDYYNTPKSTKADYENAYVKLSDDIKNIIRNITVPGFRTNLKNLMLTNRGSFTLGNNQLSPILEKIFSEIRNAYIQREVQLARKPLVNQPITQTVPSVSENVKPTINLSREWKGDLESRPVYTSEGINTMRTSVAEPNEHFGNPWSESGYTGTIKTNSISEAVNNYKEWLLGTKFQDIKPEQKTWILDQINQGKLDGANLFYSKKLMDRGKGSHATALAEVVEELRSTQPTALVVTKFQGYKGGFENAGKSTPEGDGKDKAMRQVADGFIGEHKPVNTQTSTRTSFNEITFKLQEKEGVRQGNSNFAFETQDKFSKKYEQRYEGKSGKTEIIGVFNNPKTVMLARNGEYKGEELNDNTKALILQAHNQGAEFVVGDMPGVDSQFIDYLQEIGAKFTIYHTGNTPRIQITQPVKPTEKNSNFENIPDWEHDSSKDNNNRIDDNTLDGILRNKKCN